MHLKIFEIWRQRKGEDPKFLRSLASKDEVDALMTLYREAESRIGVEIKQNEAAGFTCYKSCFTITTGDGSGLPRSKHVMLPVSHYWWEHL